MDELAVRERVRIRAKQEGGVRALARLIGCSPSYVSDVLNGRRAPGPPFLDLLGLERVVTYEYRPIRKAK